MGSTIYRSHPPLAPFAFELFVEFALRAHAHTCEGDLVRARAYYKQNLFLFILKKACKCAINSPNILQRQTERHRVGRSRAEKFFDIANGSNFKLGYWPRLRDGKAQTRIGRKYIKCKLIYAWVSPKTDKQHQKRRYIFSRIYIHRQTLSQHGLVSLVARLF